MCNHDPRYYSDIEQHCIYCEVVQLREKIPALKGQAIGRDKAIKKLLVRIEALQDKLNELLDDYKKAVTEPCADEKHCACVPALQSEIEYLRSGVSPWRFNSSWHTSDMGIELEALKKLILGEQEERKMTILDRLTEHVHLQRQSDLTISAAEAAEILAEIDRLNDYADRLAAGLPDGKLPKDIENIKRANAEMATRINKLTATLRKIANSEMPYPLAMNASALEHYIDLAQETLAEKDGEDGQYS